MAHSILQAALPAQVSGATEEAAPVPEIRCQEEELETGNTAPAAPETAATAAAPAPAVPETAATAAAPAPAAASIDLDAGAEPIREASNGQPPPLPGIDWFAARNKRRASTQVVVRSCKKTSMASPQSLSAVGRQPTPPLTPPPPCQFLQIGNRVNSGSSLASGTLDVSRVQETMCAVMVSRSANAGVGGGGSSGNGGGGVIGSSGVDGDASGGGGGGGDGSLAKVPLLSPPGDSGATSAVVANVPDLEAFDANNLLASRSVARLSVMPPRGLGDGSSGAVASGDAVGSGGKGAGAVDGVGVNGINGSGAGDVGGVGGIGVNGDVGGDGGDADGDVGDGLGDGGGAIVVKLPSTSRSPIEEENVRQHETPSEWSGRVTLAALGGAGETGTPVPEGFRPSGREGDFTCTWSLGLLHPDVEMGALGRGGFGKTVVFVNSKYCLYCTRVLHVTAVGGGCANDLPYVFICARFVLLYHSADVFVCLFVCLLFVCLFCLFVAYLTLCVALQVLVRVWYLHQYHVDDI